MRTNDQPSAAQLKSLNKLRAQKSGPTTRLGGEPSGAQLAQLRQMQAAQPSNTGFGNELKHVGESLGLAGPGHALQDIGKTIAKGRFETPLGEASQILPSSVTQRAQQQVAPVTDYNIAQHMGIPNTLGERIAQGLGEAIPSIGLAVGTAGATLPEMAGTLAAQGGYGAATTPSDPVAGGIESALFQGAGDIAPVLGRLSKGAIKGRSIMALGKYGEDLQKAADKSYAVLKPMAKNKPLIDGSPHMMPFGNIKKIAQAQAIVDDPATKFDVAQGIQENIHDANQRAVFDKIDNRKLNDFLNLDKKSTTDSHNAFKDFSQDPTESKLISLKTALSRDRTAGESSRNITLQGIKDQVRDNIVRPFVAENGTAAQLAKYNKGDLYKAQLERIAGSSSILKNIMKGGAHPRDISGNAYLNALGEAHTAKVLQSVPKIPGAHGIPLKQYIKMHKIFGDEGHPLRGIGHFVGAAGSKFSSVTPLLQAGAFTRQQMPS